MLKENAATLAEAGPRTIRIGDRRRRMRYPALLIGVTLLAGTALGQDNNGEADPAATQPAETDLPVRAVTLYSSGVGYFEHAGTVNGQANAVLRFKTEQINDLLKSLVLQDMDGGLVQAVTYPSNDPIERQLGSFQIDLSGEPSLGAILSQLRGARVTLDNNISGTILGVEEREVAEGDTTVTKQFLNIFTGTGLRSVPIDTISTFTVEDQRLQQELARALEALGRARDKDKKSVGFNFSGEGERRVRLGYVVESPVWKSSYRLLLGGDDVEESKGNLQGWAIVENQTDNDWDGVRLSLVSGRPMSFIMDLYQPLYVQRPVVVPELFRSLVPKRYDEGMMPAEAEMADQAMRQQLDTLSRRAPASAPARGLAAGEAAAAEPAMDPAASVQSVAAAADLGELFEYVIGEVEIARQSSAMIPIVTDPVEAEKVSIYDATVLEKHPLNGAIFRNTTEKHLLQGPVTVYEDGGYAGDAQIGDLPPGETRLLSWGIDLKLGAQHEQRRERTVLVTGRIVDGMLYLTRRHRTEHAYTFRNDTDRPRTVVLVHPFDRNFELVDTPAPYETTDTARRFRLEAGPGRTDFLVSAERMQDEGVRLAETLTPDQFMAYASQGQLPEKVREALAQAAQLQSAVMETQRQLQLVQAETQQITEEQGRMRENMKAVDSNSDYYKRLLNRLDEQETRLEELSQRRRELQDQLEERRQALREFLADLDVR